MNGWVADCLLSICLDNDCTPTSGKNVRKTSINEAKRNEQLELTGVDSKEKANESSKQAA